MTIRRAHPNPSADDLSLAFLEGQAITRFDATAWPTCLVEFSRGDVISTTGLWRVIADRRIVVTSDDHEQLFGLSTPVDAPRRAMEALNGRHIQSVALGHDTGDLRLQFDNGCRFECVATSCGYENWELRKVSGELLIAHADSRLTFFARGAG